ncbi:hypothetical protein CBM2599_A180061 [Cupriavidus taiwanensis]|uniref:Uncharacterized protein n=1 Tax=Cupriavidus taiwanensis TaxID=164546 RepID=A0A375FBH1_9BURK|nr:hypothetical protein CBM2599_A180061 [Cupriavidus taiwanensis]SOY86783.1 hypothetical protein CBM2600_A160061 [Cupriavidus taiwanensis]SPA51180.1 protein of unknown function [Cupriavidus taiwanensis]SPD65947.1 protein of unknown function [Cupriavidus taiwanensis]
MSGVFYCAMPAQCLRLLRQFPNYPRTNLTRVISDGAPNRFGGPQYPVPRLI